MRRTRPLADRGLVTRFRVGFPGRWLALLLIVALGAAVRCATLSFQSLWLDEVSTVVEAGRPWSELFLGLFDPQQGYPLYVLGMRFWIALFGHGEVALRWPSALAGVATVPLLWFLGRRLYGSAVGLLVALLAALSPLAVWYAQEARAYALLLLLTTGGWLLLWEAIERRSRPAWWAFGTTMLLALLVHRLAILPVAGQLVYALYLARRGRFSRRHRRLFLLLLLSVLLLTLAGLSFALGATGASRQFGDQRDWRAVTNTFTQFSLRLSPTAPEPGQGPDRRWGLAAFGLLSAAAVVQLARDLRARGRDRRRAVFVLCFLGVPLGTYFLLYLVRPFYHERYLLAVLPAYLLLLAVGGSALWRWAGRLADHGRRIGSWLLGAVGLAALLVPLALSWNQIQEWSLSRRPSKEQFRAATRYLQQHLHPGDLVIVHPAYIEPGMAYYAARRPRMPLQVVTLRAPFTEGYGFREFEADMDDYTRGRRRAWLFMAPYHAPAWDPNNLVYEWFNLNPFLHCDEAHFNGLDLYCVTFNSERREGFPQPEATLQARFGEALLVWGADIEPFQRPLWPGDSLPLTLYVRGLQEGLPDLEVVVRLVDQGGEVWAQATGQPLGGFVPTSRWVPGDNFLDGHELLLPDEMPAGRYTVQVGYRPLGESDGWLSLPDGFPWAVLGEVAIESPGGAP